jgi:hypothetical protein
MRKILGLILLCAVCSLASAESFTITFTPQAPSGGRWPKHILAVWAETSATAFVKTLGDWSATQRSDLKQWRAKAGTSDTDAIMGATINSAVSSTTSAWNLASKAVPGSPIADGAYFIWLECVDDSTPVAGTTNVTFANRLGIPFQKDGVSRSAVPYTDPAGKFTSITYNYTGRVPSIANPALSITTGSSTTFTLTNNAAVTPSGYQWRKGAVNIGGATSSTYTIASAVTGDSGSYDCVVTYPNTYGLASAPTMTSNALTLSVTSGSVAVTSSSITPATSTVNPSTVVTLTNAITPAGATSPVYAWYRNTTASTSGGTLMSGTASTYAPSTAAAGTYYYYSTVTAGGATVTSNVVQVTVRASPSITAQPATVTIASGGTANFSVTATDGGYPSLYYQWQSMPPAGSFANIGGATTSAYSTTTLVQGTQYRCIITNASGAGVAVTSSAATLNVVMPPTLTSDTSPLNPSVVSSTTVNLSVAGSIPASPAGTLSYAWQRRSSALGTFANVVGATSASYAATATTNGEQYRCILTNTYSGVSASTTSQTTTFTVAAASPPTFTTQPISVSISAGASATFTVAVSGVPTPTLQWYDSADGTTFAPIGGETSASYTTPATSAADIGVVRYYRCVATNGSGSTNSSTATRTVTSSSGSSGVAYVGFTTSSSGGNYAPKNVVAAWIQQGSTFIATVGDWSADRRVSLVLWNSVKSGTDAVMGATQLNHNPIGNIAWHFTPALVPDGTYTLWLESADDNVSVIGSPSTSSVTGANRTSLNFTIVGGVVVETTGAGGGFTGIRIASTPDPTFVSASSSLVQDKGKVASCGSGGIFALICGAFLLLAFRRRRQG